MEVDVILPTLLTNLGIFFSNLLKAGEKPLERCKAINKLKYIYIYIYTTNFTMVEMIGYNIGV